MLSLTRRQKSVLLVVLPCLILVLYIASATSSRPAVSETLQRYLPHQHNNKAKNLTWDASDSADASDSLEDGEGGLDYVPALEDAKDDNSGEGEGEGEEEGDEGEDDWETDLQNSESWVRETSQPIEATNGFNVFDNLYLLRGTLYVVTEDEKKFLERRYIVSRPVVRGQGQVDTEPTDQELQFISPQQARELFVKRPIPMKGVSMIFYDLDTFMNHFYHWWGEIVLGSWRVYSAIALKNGKSIDSLPLPERFIIPFIYDNSWRDSPGLDGPLMRAAFPAAPIEQGDYWQDLIKLDSPILFERVVLANRVAAHTHPKSNEWFKMISSTMQIKVPEGFFEPLRKRIVNNFLGALPVLSSSTGSVVSPSQYASQKPVVTYISRQGGRRRLSDESHEGLVEALKKLEEEGVCEVQIPKMETLSIGEQVALTARSTIVLGVHGNGLTHQLWMPPSSRSTVIEMLFPGSYIFDYEMLARNMGHKHYAMHNDTYLTYPQGTYHQGIQFGDDREFHGNNIPVYGPAVAELIRQRLTAPLDDPAIPEF